MTFPRFFIKRPIFAIVLDLDADRRHRGVIPVAAQRIPLRLRRLPYK